ncbi:hypothetical protein BDA99DRAFT_493438 [Phascolomyces articulosus]|uniref:MSP domain-containing protein n=1 Tax=Phascolomyces articulosus TaxID=60185 RepID=A0AAD5KDJ8_9FUNG|nr:hypothetical protein BDA99DRAFT_493438 [Phascolomyces articulosus]
MGVAEEEEPQLTNVGYLHQKGSKGKSSLTRSKIIKSNLYKDLDRLEESVDADFEKHLAEARAASLKDQNSNLTDYDNEKTKRSTPNTEEQEQQYYYDGKYDENYNYGDNNSQETGSILRGLEQVPFVGDIKLPFGSRPSSVRGGLSDVSLHSDNEILGDLLAQPYDHDHGANENSRRRRREGRRTSNGSSLDDHYSLSGDWRTSNHWIPNHDLVDEKYSVTPLVNPVITKNIASTTHRKQKKEHSNERISPVITSVPPPRAMSPGQYFAARSLPLDSFDEIWNNNNNNNSNSNKKKVRSPAMSSRKSSRKSSAVLENDDFLLQSFKSLPQTLSHNYSIQPVNNNNNNTSYVTKKYNKTQTSRQQAHEHQSLDGSFGRSIRSNDSSNNNNKNSKDEYVSIPVIRQDHKSDHTNNAGVISGTVRLRRIHAVDRSDTDIEDYNQYSGGDEGVLTTGGGEEEEECAVTPKRLLLQCKLFADSVQPGSSQIRITNNSTHRVKTFSLFYARGKLKFLHRQGIVPAKGHVDISVRLRRSAAISKHRSSPSQTNDNSKIYYNFETILILIDGKYSQQVDVDMEIFDERIKRIAEEESLLSQSVVSEIHPSSPLSRRRRSPTSPITKDTPVHHDYNSAIQEEPLLLSQRPMTTSTIFPSIKSKCPICVIEQQWC